jgi:hypothetical protein
MIEREPDDFRYGTALAGVLSNLGACSEQLGDLDVALAAYHEAVQQQGRAARSAPQSDALDTQLEAYAANYDRVSRRLGTAAAEPATAQAASPGHDIHGTGLSTPSADSHARHNTETRHAN